MAKALKATGRPIVFSLCQYGWDAVWEWAPGAEAAALVRDACLCGLMDSMESPPPAGAGGDEQRVRRAGLRRWNLGLVVRYGDVRRFDAGPLVPLVEALFVQAALALLAAANCDNRAVKPMMQAIDELNKVGLEFHDRVEEGLWVDQLRRLSDADDRNPSLSGFACAILLERGLMENERWPGESPRLSPGVPADLGAARSKAAQRNR